MVTVPIHQQIRAAREAAELSQAALAEAIGIRNQSAVARMESGDHEPKISTLQRIADATGATFLLEVRPSRKRRGT